MKYSIDRIRQIQETLSTLPEVKIEKEEISKMEAIKLMSREISDLQKKGYTAEMITDVLNNNDIEISVATFRTYLTKIKTSLAGRRKVRKAASASTPPATPVKAAKTTPIASPGDKGKIKAKDDAATGKSSAFVPRMDTDDI